MTPILSVFILVAVVVSLALLLSRLLNAHRLLRIVPLLGALGIITALLVAAGCSRSDARGRTHHDVTALAASAKGEVHVIGTLATLGSFEWDAAPLKTHAAADLLHIPQLLHDRKITKQQAQSYLDHVDAAHDLIEDALATCRQSSQTGKCTGNEPKARSLLDEARTNLAAAEQELPQ